MHTQERDTKTQWLTVDPVSPSHEARIRCIGAARAKVRLPSARQLLTFITVSSRWQSRVTPMRSSREPRRSSWTSALWGLFFFFFSSLLENVKHLWETLVNCSIGQRTLLNPFRQCTPSDPYRLESLSHRTTVSSAAAACACDIRRILQFQAFKARHKPWSLGPPAVFFVSRLLLDLPNTHGQLDASRSLMPSGSWSAYGWVCPCVGPWQLGDKTYRLFSGAWRFWDTAWQSQLSRPEMLLYYKVWKPHLHEPKAHAGLLTRLLCRFFVLSWLFINNKMAKCNGTGWRKISQTC